MTPEDRATKIVKTLGKTDYIDPLSDSELIDEFASAIRSAENDALERAAAWCEGENQNAREAGVEPSWHLYPDDIRDLKSKEA
jgi:hypothetical protein